MAEPEVSNDKLLVAFSQETAYIRVIGRGSFKVSTALKRFASASLEGGCHQFALDMSECIGMDSTFMGVLAGVAAKLQRKSGGKTVMVNLSNRTRGLLGTLGLDLVIEPHMAGETPDEFVGAFREAPPLAEIEGGEESRRDTAETMLEAHEELVRMTPDNIPKFKDVLKFLREDLEREES